jgi:fumarylacetoacetase
MNTQPDHTHDSRARSFVQSANIEGCDFPLQNLPLGAFHTGQSARLCVAIGDSVFDLSSASSLGLLGVEDELLCAVCCESSLNELMGLGPERWRGLRHVLFDLLGALGRSVGGAYATSCSICSVKTLPIARKRKSVSCLRVT